MAEIVDHEKDYAWLLDALRKHPEVAEVATDEMDYGQRFQVTARLRDGTTRSYELEGRRFLGERFSVNAIFPPGGRYLAIQLAYKLIDDGVEQSVNFSASPRSE